MEPEKCKPNKGHPSLRSSKLSQIRVEESMFDHVIEPGTELKFELLSSRAEALWQTSSDMIVDDSSSILAETRPVEHIGQAQRCHILFVCCVCVCACACVSVHAFVCVCVCV